MKKIKIRSVFKSNGVPSATYVHRKNGEFEKRLSSALDSNGKICLITGPSKTGKTTLYTKVLEEKSRLPLVIRCHKELQTNEFWAKALESVNFDRVKSTSNIKLHETSSQGTVKGTIGWAWLAGLIGEVSIGVKAGMSETEIREKIISNPCPEHIVPIINNFNYTLVVEDFHCLSDTAKEIIFQQWKIFSDNEISVIIVGTTHHAVDLAYANKDLIGRISHIDLGRWDKDDLMEIVTLGFTDMSLQIPRSLPSIISEQSAGLPIIVQDSCLQMFIDKGIDEVKKGDDSISFTTQDVYLSLHNVAINNYSQFNDLYERLKVGPRKAARKYETYELIISAFILDPIKFSLNRHEIKERVSRIEIMPNRKPPPASINSTLNALKSFQVNNGFELLEWNK